MYSPQTCCVKHARINAYSFSFPIWTSKFNERQMRNLRQSTFPRTALLLPTKNLFPGRARSPAPLPSAASLVNYAKYKNAPLNSRTKLNSSPMCDGCAPDPFFECLFVCCDPSICDESCCDPSCCDPSCCDGCGNTSCNMGTLRVSFNRDASASRNS
jgi:hypothetical protein